MTEQNKMLIEELEKRLLWYREEASADEFDADEVDAICTMLLKLSPERKPRRTKEEAYQNILRKISLEGENSEEKEADDQNSAKRTDGEKAVADGSVEESTGDGSGKKRRFFDGKRVLRAAVIFLAAAGVLASLNMVSYARENKSLFTMILERVGWLEIEKEASVEDTSAGLTKSVEEFYNSWAEIDRGTKEKISVPGYIPEGYSLYGIKGWNLQDRKILQAEYYDQGNGHLLIQITLWEDSEHQYKENATDEDTYVLIPEYSDENTLYYAYNDEHICMIFRENSFYRISGNIRLEKMVKIVEGM